MLRVIVVGLALMALVVGIAIVADHSSSDCTSETVIVGGQPYQVPTCR